jgi:hypothetical protein
MKKISILFILLFTGASIASYGQKTLELTDKQTGKIKTFAIGKKIRYKSVEDSDYEKGKIQNITDSTLVFFLPDEDENPSLVELRLDEIQSFQKSTTLHNISRILGGLFMVAGASTMANANGYAGEDGSSGAYIGLGAGMVAVGVIPFLIKPKTYILGETHTAKLK